MLRTEPAALSLPGPSGAAGFHPRLRLSQRQRQACCDRSGHAAPFTRRILRFLHPGKLTPGCKAQRRFAPALSVVAAGSCSFLAWFFHSFESFRRG
ncbi:hypothetical protein RJL32_003825 [Salmonella enterica]|nr:hypothetical protein [Salmonella enterica]